MKKRTPWTRESMPWAERDPGLAIEAQSVEMAKVIVTSTEIRALLAGHSGGTQGAILAELVATWLNGHFATGSVRTTKEVREELLKAHIEVVKQLMEVG